MNKRRRWKAKARRAKAKAWRMIVDAARRDIERAVWHRGVRGNFTDADLIAAGQDWGSLPGC